MKNGISIRNDFILEDKVEVHHDCRVNDKPIQKKIYCGTDISS